jgi:hypothetical protein
VDYFQGVVSDFLRANRGTYVNTECCIQINHGANPDVSGPHWYCDALAVQIPTECAYLCEISFAKGLAAMRNRFGEWREQWTLVREALRRDCGIPSHWRVRPWAFVPTDLRHHLKDFTTAPDSLPSNVMPPVMITHLEDVLPWKYKSWHREHADEYFSASPSNNSLERTREG